MYLPEVFYIIVKFHVYIYSEVAMNKHASSIQIDPVNSRHSKIMESQSFNIIIFRYIHFVIFSIEHIWILNMLDKYSLLSVENET